MKQIDTYPQQHSLYGNASECLERATRVIDRLANGPIDAKLVAGELQRLKQLTLDMGYADAASLACETVDLLAGASQHGDPAVFDLVSRSCEYMGRHSLALLAGQTPPEVPPLGEIRSSFQMSPPSNYPAAEYNDSRGDSHGSEKEGLVEHDDRRSHMRFVDDVRCVQLMVTADVELCNESFGGICVRVPDHLRLQPKQVLEVSYKGVPMQATVMWTTDDGQGRCEVGLRWA